jgi:hypothetical protein
MPTMLFGLHGQPPVRHDVARLPTLSPRHAAHAPFQRHLRIKSETCLNVVFRVTAAIGTVQQVLYL